MKRPADERADARRRARGVPAARRQGDARRLDRDARQPLRADADGHRLPDRRVAGPQAGRGDEQRGVLARARHDVVLDADEARRVAAVDRAVRRADRAGDDAVAGGAQGVHARARGAPARPRARVGRVLQPGDRARPRVRRPPTRRCRRSTAASANGGAARSTRGSPTAARDASASASGCSSPTSTTTASPAIRTRRPRRWSCGRRPTRATRGRPTRSR